MNKAIGLAALCVAAYGRDWNIEVKDPIAHTFTGANALDVDNVNGSVEVAGDGGATIRVEGERTIRALDAAAAEMAKRETSLDMNQKDGVAQIYANGPFRDRDGRESGNHGFHEHRERDYDVSWRIVVHVPKAVGLRLRTVNGSLSTAGTNGRFDVKSVNGKIAMTDVAGSGSAETVNGGVTAVFRENPKQESSFKSVNGKLDVTFQPNLGANVSVKTFNGGAYSDFETTALASPPGTAEKKDGKFSFRTDRTSRMRIGSGGPELKFETLNGGIQIRKAK